MSITKATITFNEFQDAINAIAAAIIDAGAKYDVIVAPIRGGLIPGVVLSHKLGIPLICVQWSYRDTALRSTAALNLQDFPQDSRVLIIDDIIDSGVTLASLIDVITTQFPNIDMVDVAAIVHNIDQEEVDPKYAAFTIARHIDERWIEFWWEQRGDFEDE